MLDNLSLLMAAPHLNLQLLIDGLLIGSVFALAAYGLALVWGVMNVKNLAQGDFVILGGYIAYQFTLWNVHPLIALPVAAVLMFGFGWLMYVLIIRRVIGRDLFISLLTTFGLAILLTQAMNLIWHSDVRSLESGFGTLFFMDDAISLTVIKLVALGFAALLAFVIVLFMKRSRMGQAIRATAQDARAARVLGINTDRVYAFTFALNAAICGAAGVLIAMIWVIQPYYGIGHSVRSFIIVVFAGLGNLPMVIMASLGLGAAEQFSAFVFGAEFQIAAVVCMLLAVLGWRQVQASRQRQVVE